MSLIVVERGGWSAPEVWERPRRRLQPRPSQSTTVALDGSIELRGGLRIDKATWPSAMST